MPIFVVYRKLPALTSADLHAVQRALTEAVRRVTADGAPMRYVRSTYVPSSGQCLCVFQAESSEAVARANEIAQVPFTSIDEALDISAPGGPSIIAAFDR